MVTDESNNPKIMIVDDDAAIRLSMIEFIEMAGYIPISAESGDEALKKLESDTIDLIVTDTQIPGIDGLELCEIASNKYYCSVIVMTGYEKNYSYEEAISKGASDFVYKPVRFEELLLRIRRVLKERLLTYEREHMLNSLKSQIILYKNKYSETNENKIVRIIEFPEEYFHAGISILNYFGKILHKQYPDQEAKVIIEQEGLKVKMVITTPDGEKEVVESILSDYGNVMTGKIQVEEFTSDKIIALELRNELRIAHARIETQRELIAYQNANIQMLNQLLEKAIVSKPANIEVHVPVTSATQVGINHQFDISPKFSLIQNAFEELANQFSEKSVEREYLNNIIDATKELKKCKTKNEVHKKSSLSKLTKFIDNIQKTETVAGKIIKTTKDGVDIGRKLAGYYNEIAQWCGLPQVPPPIVKK